MFPKILRRLTWYRLGAEWSRQPHTYVWRLAGVMKATRPHKSHYQAGQTPSLGSWVPEGVREAKPQCTNTF